MSHQSETIICPNCGNHATGNYCNQCGQETHLHKDTLWALTMHFIGHYFHYDSKFWQTLKTLIIGPGKLTLAYWNKQRNRYLSPISLYLFVSFIFFFAFFTATSTLYERDGKGHVKTEQLSHSDSVARNTVEQYLGKKEAAAPVEDNEEHAQNVDRAAEFGSELLHKIPKLLFFMIPIMAMVLKLLFLRRKDLTIVHHTIFSLHIQSFYFLALTPALNKLDGTIIGIIDNLLVLAPVVYTSLALRKVYGAGWAKAIIYNILIIVSYVIFIFIVMGIYFAIMYFKNHYFPGAGSH